MKPEKQLYQWDTNQSLVELTPSAQFVDYPIGDEVIRIKADGTRCRIPDEVLQTYDEKTCYERYQGGTYRAYSFTVLYAPKPPDYVFTPEERTTFEALTARADAAIDEIERRADSGEFTPVKGKDYFTEAEKNEMVQSVSSGAVGEFREVVDSATADFNENSSMKTNDYNTNAETKTAEFGSNAAEKLKAYNDNHTEKMTAYDANAADKLSTYNSNAEQKLESYNQNHTEKVAEYNQNAETKTAEFDSNAAALQEQMAKKANVDGYYEEMTVGDAEQLVATQFVEDNEPYLFRPTGGSSDVGNRAYLDKIVGGTVVWNQFVRAMRGSGSEKGLTFTKNADGSLDISGTVTEAFSYNYVPFTFTGINFKRDGRKYLLMLNKPIPYAWGVSGYGANVSANRIGGMWSNNAGTYWKNGLILQAKVGTTIDIQNLRAMVFDLTRMFGSTIADYIYYLEQSQAGAGVAWFKKLFPKDYYAYNAGELLSVDGLQSHNMVGFNQFDKNTMVVENVYIDNVDGVEKSNTGALATDFIPVIPNATYFINTEQTAGGCGAWYDADKNYISGITGYGNVDPTYKVKTAPSNAHYMRLTIKYNGNGNLDTLCINLSDPSRNGEYEPYEKHSYPLDSSLTLRGIPKLDASNNLYYDGDEYASDGTVKRKYGVVDLGTLAGWYLYSNGVFVADLPNVKVRGQDGVCARYIAVGTMGATSMPDKSLQMLAGSSANLYVKDSAYTDVTAFKEAMSGVYLVYELATPTTETAKPFQHIQIVYDFGTEEFVSTGIVPVGHKTRYPANLRDKLQHLPSLASADGTYLIQQSGKQMSLIHMPAVFPEIPTEDGTYTLKTVVTGGVATIQWVAE